MKTENPKKQKRIKCFRERNNYNTNDFWKPGQPITEVDWIKLEPIRAFYEKNGYSPIKDDMNDNRYIVELKARFRTWRNVLIAAGVPIHQNPENIKKRKEALSSKSSEPDS